tara:strand:+ start:84 stop:464 length:381 start_codon:yes stop_codon:yes gene_type:complete
MYITKIKEGKLEVPIISKENIIKRGLYTLTYKNKVIKVGCYGEGVSSNNYTRFSSYRNKGNNIVPGNGSYKTMKVLNENLEIGDKVEIKFIALPNDIELYGYNWKVDLYHEEDKLKKQHKDTLWLN